MISSSAAETACPTPTQPDAAVCRINGVEVHSSLEARTQLEGQQNKPVKVTLVPEEEWTVTEWKEALIILMTLHNHKHNSCVVSLLMVYTH